MSNNHVSIEMTSSTRSNYLLRTTSRSASNDETFFLFLFITTIDFFQKKVACCHHFSGNNFSNVFAHFFRSEEHTSELQSRFDLVCRLLLEKKKIIKITENLQIFVQYQILLY